MFLVRIELDKTDKWFQGKNDFNQAKVKSTQTSIALRLMNIRRLCPECYKEMKVECDTDGRIMYHKCTKCGIRILFTYSGH